jgi:monooxygenase
MSADAAHVTVVQRSPTYIVSQPAKDGLAESLRRRLPDTVVNSIVRWKNVLATSLVYQLCRRYPERMKRILRNYQQRWLPADFDIDTHFAPRYDPWDERLCVAPNGDFFRAIRKGGLSIATGVIETFTPDGITLASGQQVPADIIITATGLNLQAFGGMDIVVDGETVELPDTMAYKGVMLSGLPNFAYVIGYTNASWTLKADLASEFVCRLLAHMNAKGYRTVEAVRDTSVTAEPFMDLTSGYVRRAMAELPTQGSRAPWRLRQNYVRDLFALRWGKLLDSALQFDSRKARAQP